MLFRIALGLLLIAPMAWGQVNDRARYRSSEYDQRASLMQTINASMFRWGRLWLTPQLGISSLGYDSNVFSSSDEVGDVTASPKVGLKTFFQVSKRWFWGNNASVNYLWYEDTDLGDEQISADSHFYGYFKRVLLAFGGDYRDSFNRVNSEVSQKIKNQSHKFDVHATILLSKRAYLKLEGSDEELEYEIDGIESLSDRELQKVSGNLLYQVSPVFWPFVEVSMQESDLILRTQHVESTQVTVGFRNNFSREFHYNLQVGLADIEANNDTVTTTTDEVTVQSFGKYQFRSRWYLEAGYNQWVNVSNSPGFPYYLSNRILFGIGYKTPRGFEIGPDVYFGTNEYTAPFAEEIETREDDFASANLNFKIPIRNTKFNWRLVFGYEERSSEEFNDYDGYYVFTDVDYRF